MKNDSELKLRLPSDLKKQLVELGKQDRRNDSQMGRIAVEEYVRNHISGTGANVVDGNELPDRRARSRTNEMPVAETITITFDVNTLFFPAEISHVIGMSAGEINALKPKGCQFHGKKTTIRWVREFINHSGY